MQIKAALLFDRKNSWIYDFLKDFNFNGCFLKKFFNHEEVSGFDVVFLLGYTKILPKHFLKKNKLTLVVHESDLPQGKGFAPIQWQILQGISNIKISLIEAAQDFDSGDIYLQSQINFDGTELYQEIRQKQAKATIDIIKEFLKSYPNIDPRKQYGNESFYPRREKKDSELKISRTIEENFNLLRISNNDDWPAFFYFKGVKYILKIYKDE
tara:strand:+ start:2331 stop:2963 length:633 start_codon:yes stop_codon:yes gene_type:complete